MPIPFGCECGKKLQAKDEFAGKKMKCPGCGKVLTIPAAAAVPRPEPAAPAPAARRVTQRVAAPPVEVEEDLAPEPPPPPPAPAIVQFVCNCGRRLKARLADVGETIDCPDCGRTLEIPSEDTNHPPPEPAPQGSPYADGFLSQTVTPWKDETTRRGGSDGKGPRNEKASSLFGAFVLVLLVAGAGAALWYFGPQLAKYVGEREPKAASTEAPGGPVDELKHVPPEALTLVAFLPGSPEAPQLGRLLLAESLSPLQNHLPPVERLTIVKLRPNPFFGATAYYTSVPTEEWIVVRTAVPYDRRAALKMLSAKDADLESKTYKGKRYVTVRAPLGVRAPALCFADPHLLVFGDTISIKRFLACRTAPQKQGPLTEALERARQGEPLVIGLNQSANLLASAKVALPPVLAQFTAATVTVAAADGGRVAVRLVFKNAAAARAAEIALRAQQTEDARKRAELRDNIALQRFQRLQAPVLRTLASVTAGQLSPLGPVHFVPDFPDLTPVPEEEGILRRLDLEDAFQNAMKRTAKGNTLEFSANATPEAANLALPLWSPFAAMAVNPVPRMRPDIEGPGFHTAR